MTAVTFGAYVFDTEALRGRGFLTPYVVNGVTYEYETAMRVAASLDMTTKLAAAQATVTNVGALADTIFAAQSTLALVWDSGTADANPGVGKVRASTAALTSGGYTLYVSITDALGGDVTAVLADYGASTSAIKGRLRLVKIGNSAVYIDLNVTGVTTATGYRKIAVTYLAGPGGFAAGDAVAVGFVQTGSKGDTGAAGVDGGITGGNATGAINETAVTLASVSTTDIGAAAGNAVRITGTTTIAALGTAQSGSRRTLTFAAALTLTHNAASLILPTGANIVTAAGDVAEMESLGAGNWRCVGFARASGQPLAGGGGLTGVINASSSFSINSTYNNKLIRGTASLTATLATVASLPTPFNVRVLADGAGVTITGAQTINGASSLTLRSGEWADVTKTEAGAAWLATKATPTSATPSLRYLRCQVTEWNGGDRSCLYELHFLSGSVPYPLNSMTSNTAPSPLVALNSSGGTDAWKAFNNHLSMGDDQGVVALPSWWQIDLGSAVAATYTGVRIAPATSVIGAGYSAPKAFAVYGSADGATWQLLYSASGVTAGWTNGVERDFIF